MGTLARWTSSVTASFDWLLDQVENHEALVGSTIKEMQEASTKARVQLNRVQKDGETLRRKIEEETTKSENWRERAACIHKEDKEKAIECLRRYKASQREIVYLSKQLREHDQLVVQLSSDLTLVRERIADLKRKKNALSARQTRTEAIQTVHRDDITAVREIDDVFDRWEIKIGEFDIERVADDPLDSEFEEKELREDLEMTLAELIKE